MAKKHQWITDAEALEAIAERLAAARIGMPVTASDGASALRLIAQDLRAAVPHELTRQWTRMALSAPESDAAEWSAYDYTARNAAPAREAPATEAKAPPADAPMAQRFRASLNEK